MKRFITLFLAFAMIFVLVGCSSTTTVEKFEVTATVTDLQYEDSYIVHRFVGRILVPQTISEKHLVTVTYDGISETFDNQSVYAAVKEGETIQVLLCKYYDKKGNLERQELQIPE